MNLNWPFTTVAMCGCNSSILYDGQPMSGTENMAIKDVEGTEAGAVSDHENRSPILKESQHPYRKRVHDVGEPDSSSAPHRTRTETMSTVPAGRKTASHLIPTLDAF
ncbi:hypothetical protein TELCIR_06393 [Teladorsagia circumcincta]|uniref:Uncharacterized protein n=1 Tax=Teladorsagia circumcincta TaxID=45464 RepID=A0A2G9UN45_TELCI|nr:hypothetical protein TELCIR_06393 [Teladorsagia circumcincta]